MRKSDKAPAPSAPAPAPDHHTVFLPLRQAVLEELRRIAFANLTDYVEYRTVKKTASKDDTSGTTAPRQEYILKDSRKIDGAPISEITVSKDGSLKFKLYDKMKALEMLGRSEGVFVPDENNLSQDEEDDVITPAEALSVLRQMAFDCGQMINDERGEDENYETKDRTCSRLV